MSGNTRLRPSCNPRSAIITVPRLSLRLLHSWSSPPIYGNLTVERALFQKQQQPGTRNNQAMNRKSSSSRACPPGRPSADTKDPAPERRLLAALTP